METAFVLGETCFHHCTRTPSTFTKVVFVKAQNCVCPSQRPLSAHLCLGSLRETVVCFFRGPPKCLKENEMKIVLL